MSAPVEASTPAGEVMRFKSITALREALQLKPATVNRALASEAPLLKGPKAGWSFRRVMP